MLTNLQKTVIEKYIGPFTKDKAALSIYPFRYENITAFTGESIDPSLTYVIEGEVSSGLKKMFFNKRAIVRFSIVSHEMEIPCVVYNQPYFKINFNGVGCFVGKFNDKKEFVISKANQKGLEENQGVFPVYPLKAGVKQHQLRAIMKKVFKENKDTILDLIPKVHQQKYDLLDGVSTLQEIHFPSDKQQLLKALNTLKFSEALRYQVALGLLKQQETSYHKPNRVFDVNAIQSILDSLPFQLTLDQQETFKQVITDLQQPTPMRRLVLGDVGSGKTIVALLSALLMIQAGYQVAYLCPTEVLARQHYELFKQYIHETVYLSSSVNTANKREILAEIKSQKSSMIIGTHSLFSKDVKYKNLGYIIIDEQHRFGVNQRKALLEKGEAVDCLMLSATPIPRTLASTIYSHLDISTIETMPMGRKPIITKLIKENSIGSFLPELIKFIKSGQQVYMICPAISKESELDTKNVETLTHNLQKQLGKYMNVQCIHSKMDNDVILARLNDFKEHRFDVLVSTTIVEVGVHVDKANMMIVYDADRFGLSQLHQLRGRVGRNQEQAYCYVLTSSKNPESLERLELFSQISSGFKLAEIDLKLRGSGDLLGQRQSGYPNFIHLDLANDLKLLQQAKIEAQQLIDQNDSFIVKVQHQLENIINQSSI